MSRISFSLAFVALFGLACQAEPDSDPLSDDDQSDLWNTAVGGSCYIDANCGDGLVCIEFPADEKHCQPEGTALEFVALLYDKACSGCDFSNVWIDGADLSSANLRGSNFEGASMRGVIFKDADLRAMTFDGADLSEASFEGAKLEFADFDGSVLGFATFSNASGNGVSFEGADLAFAHFDQAELPQATWDGANLNGASFVQADLWRGNFGLCDSEADCVDVSMANFSGADLSSAFFPAVEDALSFGNFASAVCDDETQLSSPWRCQDGKLAAGY